MADVIMPQMGESIAEGTVTKWLKNVGDRVERDEPLFEISTDKVDAEIPSPAAGVLTEIRVQPGTTVPVNTVVGVVAAEGETAGVGLTEAEAKKRGYDVRVGRFSFGNLAKPRIIGHPEGLVKVVSEAKYDEVLGIHMVGPHVTDLISEACVALRLETTTEEIFRTVHPHPTLPETLMQAAEAVYGHAIDA